MSYSVSQYEAKFAFCTGKERDAWVRVMEMRVLGDSRYFPDIVSVLSELGWEYRDGKLERLDCRLSSITEEVLRAIAEFVVEGSFITLIGDDNHIWKYAFEDGKMKIIEGRVAF